MSRTRSGYKLTIDGGQRVCRGTTFDAVVSVIAQGQHRRYYIRESGRDHLVVTLDLNTPSLTITLHGVPLDEAQGYQEAPWAIGMLRVLTHVHPQLQELIP